MRTVMNIKRDPIHSQSRRLGLCTACVAVAEAVSRVATANEAPAPLTREYSLFSGHDHRAIPLIHEHEFDGTD